MNTPLFDLDYAYNTPLFDLDYAYQHWCQVNDYQPSEEDLAPNPRWEASLGAIGVLRQSTPTQEISIKFVHSAENIYGNGKPIINIDQSRRWEVASAFDALMSIIYREQWKSEMVSGPDDD